MKVMKVSYLKRENIKRSSLASTAQVPAEEGSSSAEASILMGAASSSSRPAIPGAYDDTALADIVENPEEYLAQLQNEWLRKHHNALDQAQIPPLASADEVDWRLYSPPAALADASIVVSEPLTEIISQSITNVQKRVKQQLQREKEEEAARKAVEDARALEAAKNREPYLPINMDGPKKEKEIDTLPMEIKPDCDTGSLISRRSLIQEQVDRRRKFGFRRLFQRSYETGESAAAGAAREAILQHLENRLSRANVESTAPDTQETLEKLRRNKTVRVPDTQELVECVSCLDDFAKKDLVKVVCHSYCNDCFIRLIAAACANEQQWPPKCCLNQIPFRTVLANIPSNLKTTFDERRSEWEVPIAERVYCHVSECSVMIPPKDINLAKRVAQCSQNHSTCTICRRPAHGKNECPEDQEMNMTNRLAEEEGWKRCSKCRALVEHREACQHMTCRCGYQFCYVCCRRWCTCSCTMAQLSELKAAAEVRRTERRRREQQESEELREILAQIEELERREAEIEEQRRIAMRKERARGEILRRQTVEVKYQQLARILEALHEAQESIGEWQQEADAKDMATDAKTRQEALEKEQETELASITAQIAARIADKEADLAADLAARTAKERRIEDDYEAQLKAYWADQADDDDDNAAARIESAMLPLRQRMDRGYRLWKERKTAELDTCRTTLQDGLTMREELMYSVKHRLKDQLEDMETELARRIVAEKRWMEEVFAERKLLLAAAEAAEMVGDADGLFAIDLDAPRPETADGSKRRGMGSTDVDSAVLPTTHPLKIFDACRKQDKFVYACAPMVRYSKLAFRQTVHHYGVDLCWTPMILAKEFNRSSFARDSDLTVGTNGPQPVTILQFGANSATELARASSLAMPSVAGVDLNCGCPQGWACAETLGAALMNRRELVRDMVVETRHRLAREGWAVGGKDEDLESHKGRSVSVKIRVHDDLRKTIDFIDTVIGDPHHRNIDWLTIHPRTRHTPSTTPIRTEALEILTAKYAKTLPILLSGDVFDLASLPIRATRDADDLATLTIRDDDDNPSSPLPPPAPSNTHLSGFMSARGLLANPALFAGYATCPWEAVERFLCRAARAPLPLKLAVHHVQEMCGPGLGPDRSALLSKKERQAFALMTDMTELVDFMDDKIAEHKGQTSGLRRDLL